jgi:hypothetical protein
MNREKALVILKEILNTAEHKIDFNSISINDNKGVCSLTLKGSLDTYTRHSLQLILDRANLHLTQVGDFFKIEE